MKRLRYLMGAALLAVLLWTLTSAAGQGVYWKKDYIRDDSGQIVAEATPTPSDTAAPSPAPSSLGHSGLTATSVTLSWTGSSEVDGVLLPHRIEVSINGKKQQAFQINSYRFDLPAGRDLFVPRGRAQ